MTTDNDQVVKVEPPEPSEATRSLGTDILIGLAVNGAYDAIKAGAAAVLASGAGAGDGGDGEKA